MKSEPLVSIAILCYNQENYIGECIESCISQIDTYKSIEIIVNDDNSTDQTIEILKAYKNKFPNIIQVLLNKKNQGITTSSNNLLRACKGKYIAWMGGDDRMLEGKIAKQVSIMEKNPSCSLSYHNLRVFNSVNEKTLYHFNDRVKFSGGVNLLIKHGCFNGACSTMTRAKSHPKEGFDNSIPIASDWLFWIQTVGRDGKIIYIDEILGEYRRHDNNITQYDKSKISQTLIDELVTCQKILSYFPEYIKEVRQIYASLVYQLRFSSNYRSICAFSLRLNFHFIVLFKLILNIISFDKLKL